MGMLSREDDLPAVTANQGMLRQFARQRAGRQQLETPQQALDLGVGMLGMVPIVGDAVGLAADLHRYKTEPESRNWLNYGLTGLGMLPFMPGMTVFHGSPHKGIKQFDMNKVGTGEGAQAYGHGLYFAENPETAKFYQKSTSATKDRPTFRGRPIDEIPGAEGAVAAQLHSDRSPFETAKVKLRDYLLHNNQLEEVRYLDSMTEADFGMLKHEGQLYQVDIPDEAIAKMLDWDVPFEKQPAHVQDAIRKLWAEQRIYGSPDKLTGEGIHGSIMASYAGSMKRQAAMEAASQDLRHFGIPGIKYLDQGSRDVGGTRNLVVFDDKLPRILDEQVLRRMAEYEGRMFSGGAYSNARYTHRMLAKDAPMKKAIESARVSYNKLREDLGLPLVTDWSKRPERTGEQILREMLKSK